MTVTNDPPPSRTQIPNIVDDMGLNPYERALYVHYKRVCGENQGAYCFEATKTTAQKTKMSAGQVSTSRQVLVERGLIIVQEGRPIVVTVVNIWEMNTGFYQLEHRPDVEGWTVEQVKLWLSDIHTVNVNSHNESNLPTRNEHSLTENSGDVHTVNVNSYSERQESHNDNMSSNVHTVKQRSKDSLDRESTNRERVESPAPLTQKQELAKQITETCGYDATDLRNGTRHKLEKARDSLWAKKATPALVKEFGQKYWYLPGPPTPDQLTEDWGRFLIWRGNGTPANKSSPTQLLPPDKAARYQELLQEQPDV